MTVWALCGLHGGEGEGEGAGLRVDRETVKRRSGTLVLTGRLALPSLVSS